MTFYQTIKTKQIRKIKVFCLTFAQCWQEKNFNKKKLKNNPQ